MSLPRPRFTVRRLMIAVAIVAMVLGVWMWYERHFKPWWTYQQAMKSLSGGR